MISAESHRGDAAKHQRQRSLGLLPRAIDLRLVLIEVVVGGGGKFWDLEMEVVVFENDGVDGDAGHPLIRTVEGCGELPVVVLRDMEHEKRPSIGRSELTAPVAENAVRDRGPGDGSRFRGRWGSARQRGSVAHPAGSFVLHVSGRGRGHGSPEVDLDHIQGEDDAGAEAAGGKDNRVTLRVTVAPHECNLRKYALESFEGAVMRRGLLAIEHACRSELERSDTNGHLDVALRAHLADPGKHLR